MKYSHMGLGLAVLAVVGGGARIYRDLDRRGYFDPAPDTSQVDKMLAPDFTAKPDQRHQDVMDSVKRQQQEFDQLQHEQYLKQQAEHQAMLQASQQRMQAQLERDRQQADAARQWLSQIQNTPKEKPQTNTPSPSYPPVAAQQPQQPAVPQHEVAPDVVADVVPEVVAVPEKVIEPFAFSPKPDDAFLEKYPAWQTDGSYDRYLGQAFAMGNWRFSPSTEFELQRSNDQAAKWGAGKAGIGLDADLFTLYPRDHGMTSPVHEDSPTSQVFRLGRREVRARGDATISHLENNGLCIWRIHTPARDGDKLGSCYYMAIIGEKDAILFTCRYDATRPEQIAAFDAIVNTLEYVQGQ